MTQNVDRGAVFGEHNGGVAERIAPGFFDKRVEGDHLGRYRWASRFVEGKVVLDVACGTGYGSALLQKAGARRIFSFDVSPDALSFGLRRYSLLAAQADGIALPLPSASVDRVVSLETLEHLEDPEAFVAEVRRVLRPDGMFAVSIPNAAILDDSHNHYHVGHFQLVDLLRLLITNGFEPRKTFGQHWQARSKIFTRTWGLRRVAWEVQKLDRVTRIRVPAADPEDWCVLAAPKSP
jgi:SAM-dependent methyltransferase